MGAFALFGLIWIVCSLMKEAATPTIPAENWSNKALMDADILNPDVSTEDFLRKLASGVYR